MAYVTCACKFNDVEDDVIQWCDVHALARDEAVAAEREACAKAVENFGHSGGRIRVSHKHAARAIRERP